jgi:hypothetical protein
MQCSNIEENKAPMRIKEALHQKQVSDPGRKFIEWSRNNLEI